MFNFLKKRIGNFVESLKNKEEEKLEDNAITEEINEEENESEIEEEEQLEESTPGEVKEEEKLSEESKGSIAEEQADERAAEQILKDAEGEVDRKETIDENNEIAGSFKIVQKEEEKQSDNVKKEDAREENIKEEKDTEDKPKVAAISNENIKSKGTVNTEIKEYTDDSQKNAEKRGFGSRLFGGISSKKISEREFETIFEDLEMALLENNTAYEVVEKIKEELGKNVKDERFKRFGVANAVREMLRDAIGKVLEEPEDFYSKVQEKKPYVIMFLGVNGSGKTTSIAKIAKNLKDRGITPVIAASDTFRAAAIHQLEEHANKIGVRMIKHDYGADPAAVAFDAVKHARSGKADVVLIDTAGRLHSNENLLKELQKIKRVVEPDMTIFVGESIAGNDVLEQAETFNKKIIIEGIILTKTDVDDKGGAALSVSYITKSPIYFFANGQDYDDLVPFSKELIMKELGL